MSVLTANQITLGSVVFGQSDANGVQWYAESLTGWGSPKSTLTTTQKPRDHGGWNSQAYLTPRVIALGGTIYAPTSGLLAAARHQLNAAVSLSSANLSVLEYGETLSCQVARQDEVLYGDEAANWTTFSIQLVAADPRRYGSTISVSTGLPSQSGGDTWPDTYPDSWPATVVSGVASINNPGNISSPVVLRIDGPVTGPIVTHVSSNTQLVFSSSLTLNTGEFLIVDTGKRSVLAQGQSRRDGYVTSRGWFQLDPGPNDFAFQAQTYNSSALLTVTAPQGAWQ